MKHEWPLPVPYHIRRLREIKWWTSVTVSMGDGKGQEIRLANGRIIGYLRFSPYHDLLPHGGGGVYAVTVNGICTKVHRDGKDGREDIQAALNELGNLIVDQKTRRKPLRK